FEREVKKTARHKNGGTIFHDKRVVMIQLLPQRLNFRPSFAGDQDQGNALCTQGFQRRHGRFVGIGDAIQQTAIQIRKDDKVSHRQRESYSKKSWNYPGSVTNVVNRRRPLLAVALRRGVQEIPWRDLSRQARKRWRRRAQRLPR